jgi:hypothetical protein
LRKTVLAQPERPATAEQQTADEAAAAGAPAENGGAGTPPGPGSRSPGSDNDAKQHGAALPGAVPGAVSGSVPGSVSVSAQVPSGSQTPHGSQAPMAQDSVVVGAGNIPVPNLVGQTVRAATENAGSLGLGLQVLGSGIARAQSPAPGTRVPAGTEIVVRFTR